MAIFIPRNIWGKQLIRFRVEISAATKLAILNQNLCCRYSNQHGVIDASFRLYGEM